MVAVLDLPLAIALVVAAVALVIVGASWFRDQADEDIRRSKRR